MGIFIAWLIASFTIAFMGSDKKIGYWGGFFVCLLLSPLIGLFVVVLSPDDPNKVVVMPASNDPNPVKKTEEPTKSEGKSTADEIAKYHELLKVGAITQQEFEEAKKKLL